MLACRLSRNSVGSEHQPARRVRHSAAVRSVGSDCVGDLRRMVIGAWETGESEEGNRELETGIGRRLTSILSVSFGLFALGVPVVWLVVGMDHSAANDIPETAPELRSPVAADPTMPAVETGTGSPPPLASTTSARVPDSTSPPPTTGSASGFSAESLPNDHDHDHDHDVTHNHHHWRTLNYHQLDSGTVPDTGCSGASLFHDRCHR